ncbi:MAG: hypothetical protein ACI808_000410, partial [Paraglaciecola sp.]
KLTVILKVVGNPLGHILSVVAYKRHEGCGLRQTFLNGMYSFF